MTPPLAHIGHWLWVFYLLPVLIVVFGVLRSSWVEKRKGRRPDGN
jgi:uncharacterized membrane protein